LPGEVRLQWWRDVLTETEPGDAAANPIAVALRDAMRRYSLPVPGLLDLIDAHTFDLYDDPMATLVALEAYAAVTSVMIVRLAARVLNDGEDPEQEEACWHAGIASFMTCVLRQLGAHSARGQRYLPDDVMARHGAQAKDLRAGRASDELRAVLAELRQLARDHLLVLKGEGEGVPPPLLPAFLPASLTPLALDEMERSSDPFQPRAVPQWRKQWALWRAARKPARFIKVRRDDPAESGGRR
jgi:phytoene synthase